jgi:hypothetical protein
LELVNREIYTATYIDEIVINPISIFNIKENLLKMILIDNNYLCGCSSDGNLNLIKYDISEEMIIENDNELTERDISGINFNISNSIPITKIFDMHLLNVKNNKKLIVGYGRTTLFFISVSVPELNIVSQINNLSDENSSNCITQINEDEILISCSNYLKIIDINKFEIKLKIKKSFKASFITKLKDNTILLGTKFGIKRLFLNNLEEISFINKSYSYSVNQPYEIFNFIYEFYDGRIAICSSYGNITICKFKIA